MEALRRVPQVLSRARTITCDTVHSVLSLRVHTIRDTLAKRASSERSSGSSYGHTWAWSLASAAALVTAAADDAASAEGATEVKGDYTDLAGVWKQDKTNCESMAEFLEDGLGFPWFVSTFADTVQTTLKISFPQPGTCVIVDKTMFGRNETTVVLSGPE